MDSAVLTLLTFLLFPLLLVGSEYQKSSMVAVVPLAFYTPETGFAAGGAFIVITKGWTLVSSKRK
jgi:hypothetical protein